MRFSEITYQRPNMEAIQEKIQSLCTQFQNAKEAATQLEVIRQFNDLQLDFTSSLTLAWVRHDLNGFDAFYENEKNFFEEQEPVFETYTNQFYQTLLNSRFRNTLEEKLGKRLFQIAEFRLAGNNQETEKIDQDLNRLEGQYFRTISRAKITFQGKEYPLKGLSRFSQSQDATTRKAAKDAVHSFWAAKEKELHDIFSEMVQLRHKRSQVLGFESYIEESYHHCDYSGEEVSTFNKAVLKYFIPIKKRLHERRLKRMGVKEVHYYDTVKYQNGNPKLQTKGEELWSNMRKMYAELSPETDEFCQFMLKNKLFDTDIREGKSPGTYMATLSKYGLPFILANFRGTSYDFKAMVHEMGHAFQCYQTHKAGIRQMEYYRSQSDIAEIHAIGMELFTWDWYALFFKEDTAKFQFSKISQMLNSIVSNCCSEAFQQFIYQNPQASPTERNQKWLELEKQYYPHHGEAIFADSNYLKRGSDWQTSPHIMCLPFYAVDYSLANLCAFQFWMKSQNNKEEVWNDYLQLCRIGGKYAYFESLQLANLRSPFDEEVIREIAVFLSDWLEEVDDSEF